MWLLNPSDPHSTPVGSDHLFRNKIDEFNCNVPPCWKLQYRPPAVDPIHDQDLLAYDVVLSFDYPNMESTQNGGIRYQWTTAIDPLGPLIQSIDDIDYATMVKHHHNLPGIHNYLRWQLFVTKRKGWQLSEIHGIKTPEYNVVYKLQDFRYQIGASDDDNRCLFIGLGENRFLYLHDEYFDGAGGSAGSKIVRPYRGDVTIKPFWP